MSIIASSNIYAVAICRLLNNWRSFNYYSGSNVLLITRHHNILVIKAKIIFKTVLIKIFSSRFYRKLSAGNFQELCNYAILSPLLNANRCFTVRESIIEIFYNAWVAANCPTRKYYCAMQQAAASIIYTRVEYFAEIDGLACNIPGTCHINWGYASEK